MRPAAFRFLPRLRPFARRAGRPSLEQECKSNTLHIPIWISTWRLFRVKTSIPLKAELIGDNAMLIASLTAARKLTTDFLKANRDRDLSLYRAPHPFLGNLNLYKWHHFVAYHEERHRKQIREIVKTSQL
jgi:DinB family protein